MQHCMWRSGLLGDTFEMRDDIIGSEGISEPLLSVRIGICEVSVHRQVVFNEDFRTPVGTLWAVKAGPGSVSAGPLFGDWEAIQAVDRVVVCGAMPAGVVSVDATVAGIGPGEVQVAPGAFLAVGPADRDLIITLRDSAGAAVRRYHRAASDWLTRISSDESPLDEAAAKLLVPVSDVDTFLACLGIGTLEAIRSGAMPVEAGIWSLGVPGLWEPPAERRLVSSEILDVLATADELAAIREGVPDRFAPLLSELIERLRREIARAEDPIWHAEWDART